MEEKIFQILQNIQSDISSINTRISSLEDRMTSMEDITFIKRELTDMEKVTANNCYEIVRLKAIK